MKKVSLVLALGVSMWLWPASGQTLDLASDCTANTACQSLFDQATQQSAAGQLVGALRSYKQAYEVTPDPHLLYSIGRVLQKQGKFAEAIPYYCQFIDSKLDDDAQKNIARTYLAQCEAAVLPPPPPPVDSTPPGAAIVKPLAGDKGGKTKPIYRRWWFWTIIGTAVAAGVAGGVASGVVASQPQIPEPSYRPF